MGLNAIPGAQARVEIPTALSNQTPTKKMRVLLIGKFPPIQGGVSSNTFWTAQSLVHSGHQVHVVTNAAEVEGGFRQCLWEEDFQRVEPQGLSALVVHNTTRLPRYSHIPWSPAYGSRLLGLALQVSGAAACDVVLGWYWEPYGLAAVELGSLLACPVAVHHAGSDVGHLASHPDLRAAFSSMLSRCGIVLTTGHPGIVANLHALGVKPPSLRYTRLNRLPAPFFSASNPLDINVLAARFGEWAAAAELNRDVVAGIEHANRKRLDASLVTIGLYGKVARSKGSWDLVAALERLTPDLRFNFLIMASGTRATLNAFYAALLETDLRHSVCVLPPVAPWRVPQFLDLCDVVCVLEREFPIEYHGLQTVREALARGCCLVVSREATTKSSLTDNLVDGKNCFVIEDPRSLSSLANALRRVIVEKSLRNDVRRLGHQLSRFWEGYLPVTNAVEDALADAISIGAV